MVEFGGELFISLPGMLPLLRDEDGEREVWVLPSQVLSVCHMEEFLTELRTSLDLLQFG